MKTTSLAILIAAIVVFGAACQKKTTTTNTIRQSTNTTSTNLNTDTTTTEEMLVLANLGGVSLAPHNQTAKTAGDLSMSKTYLDEGAGRVVPIFLFGQPLPGRATTQLNPNLEFGGLLTPVTVVSAIDGIVGFVRAQSDSNDYEVFLQTSENSIWTIGYDHLTDVTVKQGDRVAVGQTLGKAARENNGMYRYELQVNKDVNGITTFHCPTELLNPTVKATQTAAIEQFITEWNTFYGLPVYGSYTSACAKPVLTLEETS